MKGLQKNKEGFFYTSEKGLNYTLLEGMSIGGDQRYSSDTVFIVLNCDLERFWESDSPTDLEKRFFKLAKSSEIFVNFLHGAFMLFLDKERGDFEDCIKGCVDDFEEQNEELVNLIIENNIETLV